MSAASNGSGLGRREAFLGWQCRARRTAMRQAGGRPNGAVTPALVFAGEDPCGQPLVTVLCRRPDCSVTPELKHMAKRSQDPAERRAQAVRFFAAGYCSSWRDFSDTLTAAFEPGSPTARRIAETGECRLEFDAFAHRFGLECRAARLGREHPLRAATWWHNHLFNPTLHPQAEIIGFEPDWRRSQGARPGA